MTTKNNVLLLGGIVEDRNFEVERYPEPGQDTTITKSSNKLGGCCLNIAITLNNLGSLPYIVSMLGDDEAGKKIEQYVKSWSLPTSCIDFVQDKETGYCLNIIDKNGERTFFTHQGCETIYTSAMLPIDLPEKTGFAYITGYYLLNRQTATDVLLLVEKLRQSECQILFDPGPLVGNMDSSQLRKMISHTDWMVPNSAELDIIQQKLNLKMETIAWLQAEGCQNIVVKKGDQGVDVYSDSESFSSAGFRVKAVDTTGAGDSFAGGLIHGLASGDNLRTAINLACACGAFTTTIEGPHGHFTFDEIDNFISAHISNNKDTK